MALTVTSPIVLPAPPRALAGKDIAAGSTSGSALSVDYLCANSLFEQKQPAFVGDWSPDGIFGGVSTPAWDPRWRQAVQPYAGLSSQTAEVWLYVDNSTAFGGGASWAMTVHNDTAGSSSTKDILKTAGVGAGWYQFSSIVYDDTALYNDWRMEEGAKSGLASTDAIHGIMIVPVRTGTTLPSAPTGNPTYLNAALGCMPFEASIDVGDQHGAHTWALHNAHRLAIYLWERRLGQILSSSFKRGAYGSAESTQARFLHLVPHGVTSVTFWIRGAASGTAKLAIDDSEEDSVSLSASTWSTLTSSVTSGALHDFKITALNGNISGADPIDAFCGWWDAPNYSDLTI